MTSTDAGGEGSLTTGSLLARWAVGSELIVS